MSDPHTPPAEAIDRLAALAGSLDQVADLMVRALKEAGAAPAVVLVDRRDRDVPAWTGLRTAGCQAPSSGWEASEDGA